MNLQCGLMSCGQVEGHSLAPCPLESEGSWALFWFLTLVPKYVSILGEFLLTKRPWHLNCFRVKLKAPFSSPSSLC